MWSGGGWRSGATAGYFTSSHTLAHTWGAEGGTERGEEGRRRRPFQGIKSNSEESMANELRFRRHLNQTWS